MQLTAYCKWLLRPLQELISKHPKLWLGMRLMAVLLLVSVLQVSAKSYSQNVTLRMKNASLEKVLNEIKKQSGYFFIYGKGEIAKAGAVDIDIVNATLEKALAIVFKEQPLSYSISDKFIVISPKKEVASPPVAWAGLVPVDIAGVVKDEKGNLVSGVTVTVKGTRVAVVTNEKGEFLFKGIDDQATLVFNGVNVESSEFKLTGKTNIVIMLTAKVSKLDEVQIIGYGTTTRRTATGSTSTVTAEEIARQPITNPLQALSGRMPGVLVTEASGTPGAGISVQIRGIGSLLSGTNPLYIIDGVPFIAEPIYTAGGNTAPGLRPSFGSSPLTAINPADIESIDVLKDADATAIYGSRGSNGVILITTKKGKPGKTKLDITASSGAMSVIKTNRVKPMSLAQYLEVRKTAFANSGATPTAANAADLLVLDTSLNKTPVDFQKVFLGNTAHVNDVNLSVSGGSQQTSFLLSGSYHRETAVIPGDFAYNRGALHFSIEHNSADRKFTVNIGANLVFDKNENVARLGQLSDLAGAVFTLAPNLPLYDSTGKNLYWLNSTNQTFDNPLKFKYQVYTAKNNNLIGKIALKYTPLAGLNLKLNTSYNKMTTNSQSLISSRGINPYTTILPSAFFMQNVVEVWNLEPQADYSRNISRGRLNVLAGATFQDNHFNQPYYIVGTNYTSDALLSNPQSAGTIGLYTSNSQYKYQSVFGRLNYNWLNKYIVNVNYRWDASSKFGINKRYGSFASVGGAWIFTEEPFLKKLQQVLSFGKLRASYGSSGNDQIGNYQYLDTYSTTFYGYNGVSSLVPSGLANPDLEWEVNVKREIGLELGFFKDRILVSGAWFLNKTNNPLVTYPLSNVTGFDSYTANLPATIKQQGMEFTLTSQNIKSKNFEWTTSFNISFADSKLTSFPGIEKTNYWYSREVGQSMSALYNFKYLGLDPATKLPSFLDANKNGSTLYASEATGLSANGGTGDKVYLGKSNPACYGGINNSFSWKGFQLDMFVQFVGKVAKYGIAATAGVPGYNPANMYSGIYDLFKQTNGKIATRTFSYADGAAYESFIKYALSDAVLSNGAYARLKNVSLSYTLHPSWISKLKLSTAQVYLHAQNLFTVTSFEGLDPETGSGSIPPLRTITAGIKLSL